MEEPNSPHHLGAYSPTRGEVISGHAQRGVSSADTAAAKRDARRLRRAREEAFEKTFTILPLDGGAPYLPYVSTISPIYLSISPHISLYLHTAARRRRATKDT